MEMLENLVSGAWNAIKKGAVGLTTLAMLSSPVLGEETADYLKHKKDEFLKRSQARTIKEFTIEKVPGIDYTIKGFQLGKDCKSKNIKHKAKYACSLETYSGEKENYVEDAWIIVCWGKDQNVGIPEISVQSKPNGEYVKIQERSSAPLESYANKIYTIKKNDSLCNKLWGSSNLQITSTDRQNYSQEELFQLTKYIYESLYNFKGLKGTTLAELTSNLGKYAPYAKQFDTSVAVYRIKSKITGLKINASHEGFEDVAGNGVGFRCIITTTKTKLNPDPETGNIPESNSLLFGW